MSSNKTLFDFCPTNQTLEAYAWNVLSGLEYFSADDLHVLENEIENWNRDRRVIGSILRSFELQGRCIKVGYIKSKRPECHGRPIMRYKNTFGNSKIMKRRNS